MRQSGDTHPVCQVTDGWLHRCLIVVAQVCNLRGKGGNLSRSLQAFDLVQNLLWTSPEDVVD